MQQRRKSDNIIWNTAAALHSNLVHHHSTFGAAFYVRCYRNVGLGAFYAPVNYGLCL